MLLTNANTKAGLLAKAVTKALLLARAVQKVGSIANAESWFEYSIVVDSGNAFAPTMVWVEGSSMLFRRVPRKARSPILVTLLPIETLVKPLQFRNAPLPILVTPFPMMTLLRAWH
jgi:hypothetical protein